MKILLFIIIVAVIGGIIGLVFIGKSIKNSIDKEYKGANIISFLFPIVGLIIYAINIGKNDKLAKSCVKTALLGMGFAIVLISVVLLSLYGAYIFSRESVVKLNGNRINTVETVEQSEEKYDSLEDLKTELLKNQFINSCELEIKGKIIYINIEYQDNNFYDKNAMINSIVKKYNLDRQYDYYFNINNKDYGLYSGIVNDNIVWSNK